MTADNYTDVAFQTYSLILLESCFSRSLVPVFVAPFVSVVCVPPHSELEILDPIKAYRTGPSKPHQSNYVADFYTQGPMKSS